MLSKSLKNINSLKKGKYLEKDSILNEIYYKNNYLIKLNELKYDFYTNLFYDDFSINEYSKTILDKLVYLYKNYKFFIFKDVLSILFVLSACGRLDDFIKFYRIFKKIGENDEDKAGDENEIDDEDEEEKENDEDKENILKKYMLLL